MKLDKKREKRETLRNKESILLTANPSCSGMQPNQFDCSFREGLPLSHYGFRMQLYCRTGFHLVIRENGKVEGVDDEVHEDAIVEFNSVNHYGIIRIRGVKSNLYLAMNAKGKLYGEANPENPATIFIESDFNSYFTYLSQKYKANGWYVGIKKSGKAKPGQRTKQTQKAVHFLKRRMPLPE
uniref:Fibroblast growth factor n=1 Tax=Clastoptera arizonana TaxID=38151 RepID=A0A1B6E0A8_9HEMI